MIKHVAAEPASARPTSSTEPGRRRRRRHHADRHAAASPQAFEATHPAWSRVANWHGPSALALPCWGATATGAISSIEAPSPGSRSSRPIFLSPTRLAVVVSAPPTPRAPKAVVSRPVGHAPRTRWLATADLVPGQRRSMDDDPNADRRRRERLRFVRVAVAASSTGEPRFELWRSKRDGTQRVRALPGERYLAGVAARSSSGTCPDPAHGRSTAERRARSKRTIGCGAVMADPPDAVDPDRRAGRGANAPPRAQWPELDVPTVDHAEEVAVIVGDFATTAEAEIVAASDQGRRTPTPVSTSSTRRSPHWRSDPVSTGRCSTCRSTPTRRRHWRRSETGCHGIRRTAGS